MDYYALIYLGYSYYTSTGQSEYANTDIYLLKTISGPGQGTYIADLNHDGLYIMKFETEAGLNNALRTVAGSDYVRVIFDSINGWADKIPTILIEPNIVAYSDRIGRNNALLGNLVEYGIWLNQYLGKDDVLNALQSQDDYGMRPVVGTFGIEVLIN